MYFKKFINYITLCAMGGLLIVACGGNAPATTESAEESTPAAAPAAEEAAPAADGVVEITLTGNDLMQYDKTELSVPAGSTVRLTFSHVGQLDKTAMGHNFVLLKPGTTLEDFATKAMQFADTDYLPEAEMGNVIAHTEMLGGGESTTIEFEAPEAGTYEYLCTFPGHFAMMRGVLTVE